MSSATFSPPVGDVASRLPVVVVGGGNMGSAIAVGVLSEELDFVESVSVVEPDPSRRTSLKALGLEILEQDQAASLLNEAGCGVLVLAVKPQIAKEVCHQLGESLSGEYLLASCMAGLSSERISSWFDSEGSDRIKLVRFMPNLAAAVSQSANSAFFSPAVGEDELQLLLSLLNAFGRTEVLKDEELIDVATAVAGSGPAYFTLLMEQMVRVGIEEGLPEELSQRLVKQTLIGLAGVFESEEGLSPTILRERVTSPNGTTARALEVMGSRDVPEGLRQGVRAALIRAKELSAE